ncbi:MAG TPA: hypothetical protein VGJ48_18190 [Pyrinomonadaceae bacterium]
MLKSLTRFAAILTVAVSLATQITAVFSQQTAVNSLSTLLELRGERPPKTGSTLPETVVAQFMVAESRVRDALNQHTFKRDVVLQTIGPNGEVTGEYIRNSQFVFDNHGRRIERVLFHPKSTIREMRITKEDIQDLAGAQLLGIDITETGKYNLTYSGIETVDLQQLIAIDVTPLLSPDPQHMSERFFVGRVWLDPNTFQIVKIRGIVEPQGKQRFPLFETWRDRVKGSLAFPVRTEADDVLHFRERDVHYRIKVRYYDYQLFGSRVNITELDDVPPETSETPESSPPQKSTSPRATEKNAPKPKPAAPKTTNSTSTTGWGGLASTSNESCTTNREAPPIGGYHWPADSTVKVYFVRGFFTPEQRAALLDAMTTWSTVSGEIGSGVTFADAGETDSRQTCQACLTIRRNEVLKQDRHHYAFFYPMNRVDRLLVSAWIDLDVGITKPDALKSFMVHELAHGLGLWDCTSCKKRQTIMNAFPGLNKDNGLRVPSRCDLATVKEVYRQERLIVRGSVGTIDAVRAVSENARQSNSVSAVQVTSSLTEAPKSRFMDFTAQKNAVGMVETKSPRQNVSGVWPQSGSHAPAFSIFDIQHLFSGYSSSFRRRF